MPEHGTGLGGGLTVRDLGGGTVDDHRLHAEPGGGTGPCALGSGRLVEEHRPREFVGAQRGTDAPSIEFGQRPGPAPAAVSRSADRPFLGGEQALAQRPHRERAWSSDSSGGEVVMGLFLSEVWLWPNHGLRRMWVPARPSIASTRSSGRQMIVSPSIASRKSTAASILGAMLPAANWPSASSHRTSSHGQLGPGDRGSRSSSSRTRGRRWS